MNQPASHPARAAASLMYRPDVSPEIQQARIRFAQKWGLRSRYHPPLANPQAERGREWSHPEAFRDWNGWIVGVVHNYHSAPPLVLNMKPVGCLYREDTRTYAGRYATLGELRARSEAAGMREKFGAVRNLFTEPPTPRRSARTGRGQR